MESDDDYQSFSPKQPSPVHHRRLKRLKKTEVSKKSPVKSINDLLSLPRVDFAEIEALESSKIRGFEDSSEPLLSQSSSEGFNAEKELRSAADDEELSSGIDDKEMSRGFDDLHIHNKGRKENESLDFNEFDGKGSSDFGDLPIQNERKETKRSLEFDDVVDNFDGGSTGYDDFPTQNDRKELKRSLESDDVVDIFDGKMSTGFGDLPSQNEKKETKRSLEFNGEGDNQTGGELGKTVNLDTEKHKKKRANEDVSNSKKERTKKAKSSGDKKKPKASSSNKRSEEKERRAHLQQLHSESQRVLRESRSAAFKPLPFVQKPISSVLEKIRQRKLEMSRKFLPSKSIDLLAENNNEFTEVVIEHSETVCTTEVSTEKIVNSVEEENSSEDLKPKFDDSLVGGSTLSGEQLSGDNVHSQKALDEESTPAFRAPLDDTQDLFDDSQTSNSKDELPSDEEKNSQEEEVLAPSVLAMQLKFDSALPDDISSDEEENDKENVNPHQCKFDDRSSSPKGDPVKAFVDDEAAEEDDSDNDLSRFRDDEDGEDSEDLEDLKDMIATGYEEKPTDNEIRNELHQKWLEEKDASGTDDLLRRLKCGSELREAGLLDEEEDDEDEGSGSEAEEDTGRTNVARVNTKKAKQMIAQMFCDKEEAFSSSDDEETEKKLVRQRLLNKVEEKSTLLSPVEDESSREVFGLIKKLNIVSEPKKKAKSSSFLDTMLTGGNSNSSSKSSFLSRASSHSLPTSRKQGSSMVKSYIFGRDDSNSRSSMMSEDSLDTVLKESLPAARKATAKFSSSQTRTTTQTTKATTEPASGASLIDILKRSSMQTTKVRHQDNAFGLSQSVFAAFKIPKKPIKSLKMEGRS